MADAKPGIYASLLKHPNVSKQLIDGSKFLHWDDESPSPQAVTLRVDPKGHLLHWRDGSGYIDSLEISNIRDTRTGRSARVPKDTKMKESCALFGSSEALVEDRTVSVIFGQDLVNIQWQNFVATSKPIAQEWCSQLFTLATNSFVNNPSFYDLLERTWTKLSVTRDTEGFISLKNFYKPFASHRDDKKRIDMALSNCGLLSKKVSDEFCITSTY
uniref:PH_14 domain-containing protein n=1 Tax=Macrostomum lignano TaxID=282301 RepID=A0A1I8I549_9PLAT